MTVNMHEAKTRLSQLVELVERNEGETVYIARNGAAVARFMPLLAPQVGRRIGVAKGRFVVPESIGGGTLRS